MPLNLEKRSLKLQGASNFRDLGGYRTRHGSNVIWRKLFRSDHLGQLQVQDVNAIELLGIRRAMDFRAEQERLQAVCRAKHITVHALPIEPAVIQRLKQQSGKSEPICIDKTQALNWMHETYQHFVTHHTHTYRQFFEHLLHDDSPVVFHCTAGKDRTGFAAALLLLALGVHEDDVFDDYLLTNHLLTSRHTNTLKRWVDLTVEAEHVLNTVSHQFLATALSSIEQQWGRLDHYFSQGLHLTPERQERLCQLYLDSGLQEIQA